MKNITKLLSVSLPLLMIGLIRTAWKAWQYRSLAIQAKTESELELLQKELVLKYTDLDPQVSKLVASRALRDYVYRTNTVRGSQIAKSSASKFIRLGHEACSQQSRGDISQSYMGPKAL